MKKLVSIYIIIIGLFFSACSNFLDKNPTNRAELSTPSDIAALLVSAYPDFTYAWFCELRSDNATEVGPTAGADDIIRKQTYYWEDVTASFYQDTPEGYFYSCFRAIAAANYALHAMEEMLADGTYSQSELNPYIGEALLARAYAHFMVANLYVEHYDPSTAASTMAIPYVTTIEEYAVVDYQTLTLQEIYNLIEQDFKTGFPLIADNAYSQPKWHFNKKAAATFISRYYLYRGLSTLDENGQDDWDKVIYYANLALEGNELSFLRDWSVAIDMSASAFGTEYSKSTNQANFLITSVVSAMNRAWPYRYSMDMDLARYRANSGTPHPTLESIDGDYFLASKLMGNSSLGCYGIFKFVEVFKRNSVNANFGTAYTMFTPIVAEEALFNLMEAYVMKDNYGAVIDLFNKYYSVRVENYDYNKHQVRDATIREKYSKTENFPQIYPHFTMSQDQRIYLTCIINVRASEFVGEGQRWFDIKRMHIEVKHSIYPSSEITLTSHDSRRPFKIPDDALRYMKGNSSDNIFQLLPADTQIPQSVQRVK